MNDTSLHNNDWMSADKDTESKIVNKFCYELSILKTDNGFRIGEEKKTAFLRGNILLTKIWKYYYLGTNNSELGANCIKFIQDTQNWAFQKHFFIESWDIYKWTTAVCTFQLFKIRFYSPNVFIFYIYTLLEYLHSP